MLKRARLLHDVLVDPEHAKNIITLACILKLKSRLPENTFFRLRTMRRTPYGFVESETNGQQTCWQQQAISNKVHANSMSLV